MFLAILSVAASQESSDLGMTWVVCLSMFSFVLRLLRMEPGQDKGAKFPTSKAPISADFHSLWLIFGRAIISRSVLEAWMLFPERARAEHSR